MRECRHRRAVIAAAGVAVVGAGTTTAAAAGALDGNKPFADHTVGKHADVSYLMQTNQYVTPVGDVIAENGRRQP